MASDLMNVGATGKYYKVGANGKAQKGLSEGDRVVTNGGTYQILKVNADGSYQSALYDENMTTKNYGGKYENSGIYSQSSSLSNETKKSLKDAYGEDYMSSVSRDRYDRVSQNAPRAYESAYRKQINSLLDKLEDREPFTYDLNSDTLYRQYRESYMNAGRQAMEDTMGQAASLTGGYGNTYAETASQAAYGQYLQKLNDKIPELYDRARSAYEDEGNELYKLYSLYLNADKSDYERYRDTVSDWQADRKYAYEEYTDEANRAQKDYYNRLSLLQDSAELESSDYWKERNLEQSRADSEWDHAYKEKKFEYDKEQDALAAAKISSRSSSKSSSKSSKGKSVTTTQYDGALKAYNSDGESGLAMYREKLEGSGYSEAGIEEVLAYARKYGKGKNRTGAKTGTKTSGDSTRFNSKLVSIFNFRG